MTAATTTFNHCAVHLATVRDTPKGKEKYGHPIEHEIVGISYIYLKGSSSKLSVSCGNLVINPEKEKDSEAILAEFAARYEGAHPDRMITFWGDGFTLPVLYFNCLRYGLSLPSVFGPEGIYPRHFDGCIDLTTLLTNHKAIDPIKMEDYVAKLTAFPNRTRFDVVAMVNTKNYKGVRSNLALDVLSMMVLYIRHQVVAGVLNEEEEQVFLKKLFAASSKRSKKVKAFLKPHLSTILE